MTSKEALEIIYNNLLNKVIAILNLDTKQNETYKAVELYCTIKQDLERLETINEVWHKCEPIENVDFNAKHLQELYDYISKVNKENKKIKKEIEAYNQDIMRFKYANDDLSIENANLKLENERLKEILSDDK